MSIESRMEALETAQAELRVTKAYKHLEKLFDDGAFTEINALTKSSDSFSEAVAAYGYVGGVGVYAYAQNSDVAGGAMSKAQAAKIKKVYELAVKTGVPVVALYDSLGGRLTEGAELLAGYGELIKNANNLSGVVPQIAVVLGSCLGTQALAAVASDILIMTEDAQLSLCPSGTNATAAENAESGVASFVVKNDDEAIEKAKEIIAMLPSNNLEIADGFEFSDPDKTLTETSSAVEAALGVIDGDSFVEMNKECGKGLKIGLATLMGATVGVVASDNKIIDCKAANKAARFVRFCDAFAIPVLTFVDAERFGCLKSASKLTSAYAEATAAKVTVVTGDAYGAVYIALAGTGAAADFTYAWVSANVSALNPAAEAVIMLGDDYGKRIKEAKDPKAEKKAIVDEFKNANCSAFDAAEKGYIEDIIRPEETRAKIIASLDILSGKRVTGLPKKHNSLYL